MEGDTLFLPWLLSLLCLCLLLTSTPSLPLFNRNTMIDWHFEPGTLGSSPGPVTFLPLPTGCLQAMPVPCTVWLWSSSSPPQLSWPQSSRNPPWPLPPLSQNPSLWELARTCQATLSHYHLPTPIFYLPTLPNSIISHPPRNCAPAHRLPISQLSSAICPAWFCFQPHSAPMAFHYSILPLFPHRLTYY